MSALVGDTLALTRRWLIHLRRERMMLFFGALQPIMWLILFGNLFGRMAEGRTAYFHTESYLTFQTAGVVVMTVLSNAFMGGIPILFDRETGFLDKMLVAPIARSSLFVSRFLYVVIFSLFQVILVLAIAAFMGVRIGGGLIGVGQILLYSTLLAASFTMVSIALAFVFKHHAAYFAISGFLITPCIFLSSALLPLPLMPTWMQVVAKLNPLTHAIEPVRAAIIAGYASGAAVRMEVHALYLVGFVLLSLGWGLRVLSRAMD